ncbi:MFS transporter [Nordella sp. HKS 07]|uniref:MFS transporter n=1 Tax=Nordella sp. HKS 07 TaxID=2712222 RepID=UPI0013E1F997|nr:MFS transporter [Nordella sp. HKS 07]QIG46442.1 MFS transporter [Nordella sp. HKS 07]
MDRQRWINLFAAIAAITVFGFALGLMFPLLSLVMEKHGVPPQTIGYNTAMHPFGILVAGFFVPHLTARFGTKRVAIAAALLTATMILAYPFMPIYWAWFVMRFIQGFAVAALFTVSEAWVVEAAEGPARSRIMGVYTGVLSLSFGLGPVLISFTGVNTILPFLIGAGFLVASMIPMFFYRSTGAFATEPGERQLSILGFSRLAPILIGAVALFAVIDAAYLGLMPVYGVKKGLSQEMAALMLAAFIVGNAVLQLPIGWIADHWSKRGMMVVCAFTTVIGSALIPSAFGTWMIWPVLVVTGAASAGIYTMALAELGERFSGNELVAGTAAFSTMWGAGALIGALIGGWAMDRFGPDGLPYATAVVFAGFILVIAGRASFSARARRRV